MRYESMSTALCARAALHGNLHIIQLEHANGVSLTASMCSNAATGGFLHIVQWLRENGCPWDHDMMCIQSAGHGHPDAVEWMLANGCPMSVDIWLCAANQSHMHILQWLFDQGYHVPADMPASPLDHILQQYR